MSSYIALESFYWMIPFVLVFYCVVDAFSTRKLVQDQFGFPLVGNPVGVAPSFVLNLIFAGRAVDLVRSGYRKFKTSAFQLIRNDGRVVILPLALLEELATLPVLIANPQAALEHDLLGHYTGLNLIVENRLHHIIVQRKLTPRLSLLVPQLEDATVDAFNKAFSEIDQEGKWSEFQPYQVLGRISARVAGDVIVGPAFRKDPTWLDISFQYTENLFRTIVVLRMFPIWMHALIYPLLPSYWSCQKYLGRAKSLLGPQIQKLIQQNNQGVWEPQDNSVDDLNILSWLCSMAKGRDRNPETISHVLVLVTLASVHTTLLRMVNVLYDVTTAGSCLRDELLEEIRTAYADGCWNKSNKIPYDRLHKLDSVLKESQRLSPPTTLGMKRLFKESYTFKDGTHIPKGTYVCLPIHAIENDPINTPHPEEFDGLRSFRTRESLFPSVDTENKLIKELLFSTPTKTSLNFGYGKAACPGRFFASCIIKLVLVKMLTEYDFAFLPGHKRPANLTVHEFLFTWPWQRMLVKRKEGASSIY